MGEPRQLRECEYSEWRLAALNEKRKEEQARDWEAQVRRLQAELGIERYADADRLLRRRSLPHYINKDARHIGTP